MESGSFSENLDTQRPFLDKITYLWSSGRNCNGNRVQRMVSWLVHHVTQLRCSVLAWPQVGAVQLDEVMARLHVWEKDAIPITAPFHRQKCFLDQKIQQKALAEVWPGIRGAGPLPSAGRHWCRRGDCVLPCQRRPFLFFFFFFSVRFLKVLSAICL